MRKERYFDRETMEEKGRVLCDELLQLKRSWPVSLSPQGAALLVLDMQEFFLDVASHACVPSGEDILGPVADLTRRCLDANMPVFLTRHIHERNEAGLMGRWWRDLLTEENPLSALAPELDDPRAVVVRKNRYDAFFGTDLEKLLRERAVTQLWIAGVMTHLCCDTTARSAFMRGFEVCFFVDGTATYNETLHRASLLVLAHGFALPVTLRDASDALDRAS